jgi:uncharacterized protein (DUF4415 family)
MSKFIRFPPVPLVPLFDHESLLKEVEKERRLGPLSRICWRILFAYPLFVLQKCIYNKGMKKHQAFNPALHKPIKVPTSIRFDADLLEALKATGKGWQSRVNKVLREIYQEEINEICRRD